MKIDEALYQLKQNIKIHEIEGTTSNQNEREKALLDYITNLQTIEQQYSAILSENAELENKINNLQNGFKSTIEELCETTEKLEKLQEKYKKMKENAEILSKSVDKIDRAIEYIKSYKNDYAPYELSDYNIRELLNILNGGDDNED